MFRKVCLRGFFLFILANSLLTTGWAQQAAKTQAGSGADKNTTVGALAQAPAPGAAALAPSKPTITSVTVFQQGISNSSVPVTAQPQANMTSAQNAETAALTQQTFVIEIKGTGLNPVGHRVLVFPATGVGELNEVSNSDTAIWVLFSAAQGYAPQEVALSLADGSMVPGTITNPTCDLDKDISSTFTVVPMEQAKDKYGVGVGEDFHVVQISIVNKCPIAIIVPLAGIKVVFDIPPQNLASGTSPGANIPPPHFIAPLSLDHVTSIYSMDRKLTGRRAIFFNSLLAAVTLAGGVQPFLGKSFGRVYAEAVSFAGGGFTTASKEVLVDMSAEQLQNIVSQSFNSSEQIAPNGGSLQKFVFLPNWCNFPIWRSPGTAKDCRTSPVQLALLRGDFTLDLQIVPATSQAGTKSVSPTSKAQQQESAALSITTKTLADGKKTTAYSQTLTATGGAQPFTWSIADGLPDGLNLDSSTGKITGAPTGTGTSTLKVTVTDASSPKLTASEDLTPNVTP
jgi:Putative Ig domain